MRDTTASKVLRWAVLAFLSIFTVVPLYVMVTSSLKPLRDVQGPFTWIPSSITTSPFVSMWSTVPLAHYFTNSIIVATISTVISVFIAILAAYAVSRFTFRGRSVFTTTILSTQMFPGVLFLLPLFLIFVNIDTQLGIKLVGTRLGLILTYLTFSLPFSVWMLVGYFDGIPRELDEAALVDGASRWKSLWQIILPAALPGVISVAIYSFMTSWGEVLFASVMTTDENRTLAVGLRQYATQTNVYWNEIMAASLVVSVPIVVAFLLAQRHLVAGMTSGAVK